jgi:hypothetical protein
MQARATKVVDKGNESVWVVNLGQFRFAHGTREGVVFDPQVAVKIKMDAWIEGQAPLLTTINDPHEDELPQSPVIDPNPLVSEKTGKSVTGVSTGPEGSGNADDMRKAAEAKAAEEAAKMEAKTEKPKK